MATSFETEREMRKNGFSLDLATVEMIKYAHEKKIDTVFQRQAHYDEKFMGIIEEGRCPFGTLGICCRQCAMGPCRIRHDSIPAHIKKVTPSTDKGTCGANADTIVARNLAMMISRGMAAHAGHAEHAASTLLLTAMGKTDYQIKDEHKLKVIASKLGVETEQPLSDMAREVALAALDDIRGTNNQKIMKTAATYLPEKIIEGLGKLDILPQSAGETLLEATHETHMGVMADPSGFLLEGLKLGLADSSCLIIATEIQDVLFGTPKPVISKIGFNTLKRNKVNLVIHGHVPLLSEKVVEWCRNEGMIYEAKKTGAEGINIVGICCTGNEVLMRQGVALAGSNLQQELILATGLVEALVIDVQCLYPAITEVAAHFHTKVISTMKEGKMQGALHIPFKEEVADDAARKIVETAIDNFSRRTQKTFLPNSPSVNLMAGFSVEACIDILSKLDSADPLNPLMENISNGNIQGAVLLAGCTSPKVRSDASHVKIAKNLMVHNILVIATGCAAQACARAGLCTSEAAHKFAGDTLKTVLMALGQAGGLDDALPPVWHFGSCVDNSRVIVLLAALAEKLGVHIKDLPVAASAAEWITEKAAAIGTGAVALGVTTHLGITPPVLGGDTVTKVLTDTISELVGGKFIIEVNPEKASEALIEVISAKRKNLGLSGV